MLDALSDRLNSAFRSLSGRGRISEANVRDAMQDVRTALLEADVHYDVVKRFCDDVVQDALGEEVLQSLKPGQQMIEIVHRRLIDLMGPVDTHLMLVEPGPTVIMLCGLQGSGKTTTCGKSPPGGGAGPAHRPRPSTPARTHAHDRPHARARSCAAAAAARVPSTSFPGLP